jgi:hypothetical protein
MPTTTDTEPQRTLCCGAYSKCAMPDVACIHRVKDAMQANLPDFIATNELRMTATWTDRNPHMQNSEDMHHWRCTINRKGGSRMSLTFSMGRALLGKPTLADVLDCLASDASSFENTPAFEDWAGELGYDIDSRAALKTFNTVANQSRALKRVLGAEAYETLLWNTERL